MASGLIGSSPPDTQIDDLIYLVFGSPVPLMLRSTADIPALPFVLNGTTSSIGPWFSLVGYAYVHGIMDGEAAQIQSQTAAGTEAVQFVNMYTIGAGVSQGQTAARSG